MVENNFLVCKRTGFADKVLTSWRADMPIGLLLKSDGFASNLYNPAGIFTLKRRLNVVPGLTCTWQISGRGSVSFSEWARMDRDYIRRRSFLNNVKLLALTVPAVLGRKGAM